MMSPLEVIANDENQKPSFEELCSLTYKFNKVPCILIDRTGPPKIFMGSPVKFWLTKILLMDILRTFSPKPMLRFDRRRWVMIDIDDIFVAPEGLKMTKEDVQVHIQ